MIKQLKNYFYERFTDSTISPPNFLPMIVTTRDKATQLMEGKLEMPPMISREQVEALEVEIRRKYPVLPEKESITKGYLINTADLYTLFGAGSGGISQKCQSTGGRLEFICEAAKGSLEA